MGRSGTPSNAVLVVICVFQQGGLWNEHKPFWMTKRHRRRRRFKIGKVLLGRKVISVGERRSEGNPTQDPHP